MMCARERSGDAGDETGYSAEIYYHYYQKNVRSARERDDASIKTKIYGADFVCFRRSRRSWMPAKYKNQDKTAKQQVSEAKTDFSFEGGGGAWRMSRMSFGFVCGCDFDWPIQWLNK